MSLLAFGPALLLAVVAAWREAAHRRELRRRDDDARATKQIEESTQVKLAQINATDLAIKYLDSRVTALEEQLKQANARADAAHADAHAARVAQGHAEIARDRTHAANELLVLRVRELTEEIKTRDAECEALATRIRGLLDRIDQLERALK